MEERAFIQQFVELTSCTETHARGVYAHLESLGPDHLLSDSVHEPPSVSSGILPNAPLSFRLIADVLEAGRFLPLTIPKLRHTG